MLVRHSIFLMLVLKKFDFHKQNNPLTNEPEYRVNLRQEILKRSRRARSEITNYTETIKLLDTTLNDIDEDDYLFPISYRSSKKIIDRAVERTQIKCIPNGEKVTWKDLRSGMACDLLSKGWTIDEVNARLGHKPSSSEIDKYVNFLAIDRHRPKKKVEEFKIGKLKIELEETKERGKLQAIRLENQTKLTQIMEERLIKLEESTNNINELRKKEEELQNKLFEKNMNSKINKPNSDTIKVLLHALKHDKKLIERLQEISTLTKKQVDTSQ